MPKVSIKAGTTSYLTSVFIQDTSVTNGAGLTGLVYNTASLTAYYYRKGAASAVAITLATMTLGTWATGGFIVVDGTNMPGLYQIGLPDAAVAAGATSVIVYLKGAANMAPVVFEIELTAVDNQSATAFMTSVGSVTGSVGSVTGAVGSVTGNVGGNVTGSTASVTAAVTIDQTVVLSANPTAGTIGEALWFMDSRVGRRGTAQAGGASTITLDAGASATDNLYRGYLLKITSGTGSGQRGTIISYVGSTKVATIARKGDTSGWDTIPDNTSVFLIEPIEQANVGLWVGALPNTLISGRVDANAQATAATLTFNQTGNVSGSVGSVSGAVGSVTGNVGGNVVGSVASVTAGVTVTTNNDKTGYSLSGTQAFNVTGNITGNLSGSVGSVTGAVGSVTGNVGGNVVGSVGSVTGNVTLASSQSFNNTGQTANLPANMVQYTPSGGVATNLGSSFSFPNGTVSTFAGGAVASVTGSVGSVTGNVGGNLIGNVNGSVSGNVSGSVGSVTGAVGSVTGPVGSVSGNVNGNVVGSVDHVTNGVGSVIGGMGGDVAGKVLGGGAGTISGDGVRASSVTGSTGSVTGAVGSVTGNIGGNVTGSIGAIVTDAVSAAAVSAAAVSKIQNGLATDAHVLTGNTSSAAAATNTTNLPAMIEDVSGPRFTTHALMEAPTGSGGGGGGSVTYTAELGLTVTYTATLEG